MPVLTDNASRTLRLVVLGTGLAGIASRAGGMGDRRVGTRRHKAPRETAGGNTRFSGGGFRIPRGDFTPDDFFEDRILVTRGAQPGPAAEDDAPGEGGH
jgi:hypothetical protein